MTKKDLTKFNGIWEGQPCFVVGGGYSLNDFDFDLLQGQNVIAVNRSFEKCHFAQFFITMDYRFLLWLANGTLGWDALQLFGKFEGEKFFVNTAEKHPDDFPIEVTELTPLVGESPHYTVGVSRDLSEGLYSMGNSGGAGIQLAIILGANPIYLLGFDGDQKNDKSHHHPEYPIPTKGESLRHYKSNFEIFAPMAEKKGIKIININDPEQCGIQCFEFIELETDRNPYIVVSFHTDDEVYSKHAECLEKSLIEYGIDHEIVSIPGLPETIDDWKKNTHYKPEFILKMLRKHKDKNVVWIDADAEVKKYPKLFDTLTCDLAVHYLGGQELLSGTMFFRNSAKIRRLVKKWVDLCKKDNKLQKSEQINLQEVIERERSIDVFDLPYSYTKIFDKMKVCPVIQHYQASRVFRRRR